MVRDHRCEIDNFVADCAGFAGIDHKICHSCSCLMQHLARLERVVTALIDMPSTHWTGVPLTKPSFLSGLPVSSVVLLLDCAFSRCILHGSPTKRSLTLNEPIDHVLHPCAG